MKRFIRHTTILFCTLVLTSCLSPVKLKSESMYLLNAMPSVKVRSTHPLTLMVTLPRAVSTYDTVQMAYSVSPYQIAYYEKNRWAETPAQMLQPLLVQTLQNMHYFHAVVTPPTLSRYDYVLNSQLLQLLQDYTTRPARLRLKLRAEMVQVLTGKVVSAKTFVITQPMLQYTPYGGVLAANKAISQLLAEMVEWQE